jgi:photosystem II stability/assembly factor-like uncharacterized protein
MGSIMKYRKLILVLILSVFSMYDSLLAQMDSWKEFAPFYSTQISVLAKHPSGKIFAATVYDGLYVSDDHGNNWKRCYFHHTNLIPGGINNIAIDSSGIIYIDITFGGLKKSTDEGKTWNDCVFPYYDEGVSSITTDKSGNIFIGTRYGLYESKDQGVTWNKLLDTKNYYIVRMIRIVDGIIYALVDQTGIFKSKDNGKTWSIIQLPYSLFYWSILVINEDEIYLAMTGFSALNMFSGFIRTIDGGISWTQVTDGITTPYLSTLTKGNNNTLLAGGILGRVYKSDSSHNSWHLLTSGKSTGNTTTILVDGNRLIAGNRMGGILVSDDDGNNWQFSNSGFKRTYIRYANEIDSDNYLVANTAGIFKYRLSTNDYTGINEIDLGDKSDIFGDLGTVEINGIVHFDNNNYLISTYQGPFLLSNNQGANWQLVKMQYNPEMISFFEKTKSSRIYFSSLGGDKGLFKSDDNGITWSRVKFDFSYCQAITSEKGGNLLAGNLKWLYESTNDGTTWNLKRDFGSQIKNIIQVSDGTIFLLTESNGIYSSSDNGTTWTQQIIKDLFDDGYTRTLQCNKLIELTSDHLLMATQQGLYESINNGTTWTRLENEFKKKNVLNINFDDNEQLIAVTDSSVYICKYSTTYVEQESKPTEYVLSQNYPNPFNPTTTIEYEIPITSKVKIEVYDVLGREVTILLDKEQMAGKYKLNFDGSKLSSGIYLYRITAGDYVQAKKMILAK